MSVGGARAGPGPAARHATALLGELGVSAVVPPAPELHPDLLWARCGAMALSGRADGPPQLPPSAVASCAEGAARALAAVGGPQLAPGAAAALLGERAAIAGFVRRGATSCGGAHRLLRGRAGVLAVGLPREEDLRAVPAWLEREGSPPGDREAAFTEVERALGRGRLRELAVRATWLGLPVAEAAAPGAPPPGVPPWLRVVATGARRGARRARAPRVLDLSALWAGPLLTSLLAAAGARVVKLEDPRRPDGARSGPRAFFELLNRGKRPVGVELGTPRGDAILARLLDWADLVVEGSRPRALRQLGIDAEHFVRARPGRVWLSLTAWGREGEAGQRVGFGDDVAAGCGLLAREPSGGLVFLADALADPLAGLHGAVAALAAWRSGESRLLDLSLAGVAARVARVEVPGPRGEVREGAAGSGSPAERAARRPTPGYRVVVGRTEAVVSPPVARAPAVATGSGHRPGPAAPSSRIAADPAGMSPA